MAIWCIGGCNHFGIKIGLASGLANLSKKNYSQVSV